MILAIDHVQLAMPKGGEPAARELYGRQLGFTEIPKPPHLAVRGGCWFRWGAVDLHLGVEADFRPARKAHVAFRVENLASVVRKLRAADVAVTEESATQVYIDDPFGNRLELVERPTSPG